MVWKLQDAKARFSEFLNDTLQNGPQIVSRRGVEAAVLLPIEEWRRLQRTAQPALKDLLLAEGPRFEEIVPPRGRQRRRRPVRFR